jgi:hypothetical protein
MKRISSNYTFFYKRVIPVFWFGFLVVLVLSVLLDRRRSVVPLLPVLITPVLMAIFGYVLFRKLLFDLVDEVWDDDEALIVKNSGIEERVALKNIMNVGFSTMSSPQRVTLTLREPGQFGREISFNPPARFLPFSRSPIVDDLIERVDAARRQDQ